MAGPEERGGRGAGGSGEAQAQGQPRDSAMALVEPTLGPSRDEPRVFGLDKFNCDIFAECCKHTAGGIERFVTARLSKLKLRAAITKLVVTGDLPFRIVELDVGVIPSRWTVARDTVVLADLVLEAAIAELASTTCAVSYSTDMWTGPNGKAYMVLIGHFVSVQWELRQVILAFVEMPGRHGGKEIAKAVEKVVVQWKLQTRCLVPKPGPFCFCPHHNTLGTTKEEKEKWRGLRVTDVEWEALGALDGFLRPFARVSTAAEGSTYPTVSMVLPYFYALIDSLEKKLHTGTHELVRPLMSAALGHLKQYEFAIGDEYWIGTFLDPSMKAEYFTDSGT
ncbi:unnamed protein product [Closterium sp. NIES-53]